MKYTKISELKPHPAVWMRVINALHWGVDLKYILKKAGISQKDWDDNKEWANKVLDRNPPDDYEDEIYNPLNASFSVDKIPKYED